MELEERGNLKEKEEKKKMEREDEDGVKRRKGRQRGLVLRVKQ
jgi:hypothetical protein